MCDNRNEGSRKTLIKKNKWMAGVAADNTLPSVLFNKVRRINNMDTRYNPHKFADMKTSDNKLD
jgi:hypothetical protein